MSNRTSHLVAAFTFVAVLLMAPMLEAWLARPIATAAAQPAARPSILVIQTDDMRSDDLRAMPKTMAILGGGGVLFDNYIAGGTPFCCPNRSTALTGLYPHNHGVLTTGGPNGGDGAFRRRGNEHRTIAVALSAVGYRTAFLGKYLQGYPAGSKNGRVPPGWSQWHALIMDKSCRDCQGGGSGYYYNYKLNQNGRVRAYGSKKRDYSTNHLTRQALAIIRQTPPGIPLFMIVNPVAPHMPAIPAPGHQRRNVPLQYRTPTFNSVGSGKAAWIRRLPPLNKKVQQHIQRTNRNRRRSLVAVDDMVAKLVAAMPPGSYVFFLSDNGYMLGDFRIPAGKIAPYRASAEVPLLVAGPGIAPNSVRQELVASIDLAPTWAEIGGATLPGPVDGISLLPLLHGGGLVPRDSVLLEWRSSAASSAEAALEDGDVIPASLLAADSRPAGNKARASRNQDGPRQRTPNRQRKRRNNATVKGSAYVPPPYYALRGANWLYIEWSNGHREYYDHATDPYELHSTYHLLSPARQADLAMRVQVLHNCVGANCTVAPT